MSIRIQRPRCWSCIAGQHYDEATPHCWMDDEDATAAGMSWPLTDEQKRDNPCACECGGGKGGCEIITARDAEIGAGPGSTSPEPGSEMKP